MRSQPKFDALVTTALWICGFFSTFGFCTELPCSQLTWRECLKIALYLSSCVYFPFPRRDWQLIVGIDREKGKLEKENLSFTWNGSMWHSTFYPRNLAKGALKAVTTDFRIQNNICMLDCGCRTDICCRTDREEVIWDLSPFPNLICSNNCFWERILLWSFVVVFLFSLNGKADSLYVKMLLWEKQEILPAMFPGKTLLFFVNGL